MFTKLKYIIIFIIIINLILQLYVTKIKLKSKICICCLGKEENRYIREFVSFYKKIGVDKIFLIIILMEKDLMKL